MTIKAKTKSQLHACVVEYFKEILFYNRLLEKPKIKLLKKTLICFLNFLFMKS